MKFIIAALSCIILSGTAQAEGSEATKTSATNEKVTEVKSEATDLKDSKIKNIKKSKDSKNDNKVKEDAGATTTATPSSEKATKETKVSDRVTVVMETSVDTNLIEIELYGKEAPVSVANFLKYVDEGFYDGLIFHRVIPEFMIQGGGMTPEMKEKPNHAPIKNEATNGLKNERGSLAMARTNIPDSATSQFFINTKDNSFLNHRAPTMSDYGYAVFGKVVKGMEVVDKIERVTTTRKGMHENVPAQPVIIKKVTRKALAQ